MLTDNKKMNGEEIDADLEGSFVENEEYGGGDEVVTARKERKRN